MAIFEFTPGTSPLLISVPHAGTELPPDLAARLEQPALALPDTDWHVPLLYDFARELGAGFLVARYSRYVIDLNRPPDGRSLYPGQASTDLCPTTLFDGTPLYRPDAALLAEEVAARRQTHWQPYHDALQAELRRLKQQHGYALLYDAHSIRSTVPRLFEGRLPDLNLGTARGASCRSGLGTHLMQAAESGPYSAVLDGRFVGGYITRHYGRPEDGVQAVQMELAQASYMEESPPFRYDARKAAQLKPVLRRVLETYLARATA